MNDDPKCPRDWLLARHESSTPRLDATRGKVVAPLSTPTVREFLADFFRPHRLAWRLLAGVWFAIAVVHFTRGRFESRPSHPAPSAEAFARWLGELKSHETLAQIDHHP